MKGRPHPPRKSHSQKAIFHEGLKRYLYKKRINPFHFLACCIADDSMKAIGVDANGKAIMVPAVDMAQKIQCAKELCQYLQPKLKSVEVSGNADNPVTVLHEMTDADLDALIARRLRQVRLPAEGVIEPGYGDVL